MGRGLVATGVARGGAHRDAIAAQLALVVLATAHPELGGRHARLWCSAVVRSKVCSCTRNCKQAPLAGALCTKAPVPGRLRLRAMLCRVGQAPMRSARDGCPKPVRRPTNKQGAAHLSQNLTPSSLHSLLHPPQMTRYNLYLPGLDEVQWDLSLDLLISRLITHSIFCPIFRGDRV